MQPRTDDPVIDLGDLERRLEQRACWHEDPAAYREGVHDTLDAVRGAAGTQDDRRRPAMVG